MISLLNNIIIYKMNHCVYRSCNNCTPCINMALYNYNYCYIHINNSNVIYDIINKAIGRNEINNNNIYILFKYIINNDDIYAKEFIFKGCLKILFQNLNDITLIYPNIKETNKTIFFNIVYNLNLNTYNFEKKNYNKFKIIYRYMIKYLIKKHYYNESIILNNINDPFTLENINDINKEELFIYKENNDTNYFFIASELKYFIETNGNWNPYTKQEISSNIIRNLDYFIKYNKLNKKKPINKFEWNSIQQAFTDVSQIIEKIGFYNDTKWLLQLTSNQIKNTIKTFKIMSRNNIESSNFFNNINDNNIFYDFAREVIMLFENGNNHFILCCNFIKAISLYSDDFYNNIPEWMSDIENNTNIITIPITNNNLIDSNIDIIYFVNIFNNI